MQGHSKELQAAAARFAEALPITSELADAADKVLTEIQAEIDATDAEIEGFGPEQPLAETGTEMAVAFPTRSPPGAPCRSQSMAQDREHSSRDSRPAH
jgi:hypothetical protein